jgi:hypothetical protein
MSERARITINILLVMSAALVIAAPAYSALIRWTPEKVEAKLKAQTPMNGSAVLLADCQGLGKGVKGSFVRFQCRVQGDSEVYNLRLRVQQIGSGKLCVSALQSATKGTWPWVLPPARLIRPEKICTA